VKHFPSCQTIEVASWRLATELMRRHPTRFQLIETQPGGGQYDCLSLYDRRAHASGPHFQFNRAGRLHWFERDQTLSWDDFWWDVVGTDDMKRLVERIEAWAGIPSPAAIPPTSAEVLVYRVISALLTTACFGRDSWRCVNGYLDSSGGGGGPRTDYFDAFPLIAGELLRRQPNDLLEIPEYRFWFVLRANDPVLAFEISSGTCWDRDGRTIKLLRLYAQSKRVHRVVMEVAGDLLP